MTNAEAIKTLHELWRETNDSWYEEVYGKAIKALEAQDSKTRRICDTCKHNSTSNKKWPCVDCDMREPADRWEPKEAKKLDAISRQAAIDILDAYQVMVENGEENPYAWARLRMSELPSAQPEIIRCKNCKHKYLENLVWHCPFGLMGGENFFCGYGSFGRAERRTDEDD